MTYFKMLGWIAEPVPGARANAYALRHPKPWTLNLSNLGHEEKNFFASLISQGRLK